MELATARQVDDLFNEAILDDVVEKVEINKDENVKYMHSINFSGSFLSNELSRKVSRLFNSVPGFTSTINPPEINLSEINLSSDLKNVGFFDSVYFNCNTKSYMTLSRVYDAIIEIRKGIWSSTNIYLDRFVNITPEAFDEYDNERKSKFITHLTNMCDAEFVMHHNDEMQREISFMNYEDSALNKIILRLNKNQRFKIDDFELKKFRGQFDAFEIKEPLISYYQLKSYTSASYNLWNFRLPQLRNKDIYCLRYQHSKDDCFISRLHHYIKDFRVFSFPERIIITGQFANTEYVDARVWFTVNFNKRKKRYNWIADEKLLKTLFASNEEDCSNFISSLRKEVGC